MITQTIATIHVMINQIYNDTANAIPKCTRSFIPKSSAMRITCVAALALGCAVCCAVSYKIAKNWYQDYQFKSALVKWASGEGGKANEAVERILNCYENKRANLCLSGLSLKSLPDSIGKLTGLTSLDVSNNELESLPDSISGLIELTSLNVSNNKLKSLWDSIDGLTALTILNASNNELALLPDSIGRLKALRTLNVSNNELVLLPDSIGRLKALRTLNVWHNNLKSLPDSIDGLTALAWLDASSNKLETLPESIGELKDPDKLCIWKNPFRSELAKWASNEGGRANEAVETILDCYENKRAKLYLLGLSLKSLPDSIGELKSLETLIVSFNELESIPESIGELKALTRFELCDNKLESLPELIGRLEALTILRVSSNKLESIPESIGRLKALTRFDVSHNKLESLPESIEELQELKNLRIYNNRLSSLPETLSKLAKLEDLNLGWNLPLSSIPDSLLTLNNTCTIHLVGAGLSEHYLSRINRITSQEGYEGPTIEFSMGTGGTAEWRPLQELLNELYGIAGCAQPQSLLLSASESEENSLRNWLSRLSDTYEYRSGGVDKKKGLAKKITGYLELANNDESFYDAFFSLIQGETDTCGDRIALSIMRLGVLKRLVESDLSNMKGLAELLKKGVWTIGLPAGDSPVMGLLEQCANAKMQTMRFYDDVEVILAYPVKLKESLELPLDIEDMLFYGFSYVTDSDIDAAKGYVEEMWSNQEEFHEFLIGQTKWLEALKHNYPDEYSIESALELTKKALQPC